MAPGHYQPIKPGTRVKTTQPNIDLRKGSTQEAWDEKKWGVEGVVITHHDSHGLCYDVKHDDGTEGCYDSTEFEIISKEPSIMPSGYPPIKPGTRVRTTQQNESMADEWTLYAQERRKWGVEGTVAGHHDSHGLCYDVKHDGGTEGTYDPSEFEVI